MRIVVLSDYGGEQLRRLQAELNAAEKTLQRWQDEGLELSEALEADALGSGGEFDLLG